ncbi:uncharacterized protein LOC113213876 isoform X3 [Frankliniella occidentalis]|uniref:Uncharacterized protein LOC113213876 isoform X3 n=1 Tax=Frankliniella occidentalis TaxID=133901 RepID=A0A6J1T5L1_FRAOC|nr:uncharacterized protein LOC113213876 isoform X3 [Frankliniella occidentalis]
MLQEILDNLRIAVEQGRTDIIRSVLEACESQISPDEPGAVTKEKILNSPCLDEGTFLHLATKLNHGDVVRTLLAFGSDPRVQNKLGLNAVDAANHHLREIYIEELLRATASSDCERVCQLLAAGISVNSWDSEESGNTPLHWAACYGNREIVSCLLDRGADVNSVNSLGVTPLHDAVARGDIDVIEELIQAGANAFVRATKGKFSGKTAFEIASQKPSLELIITKLAPYETASSPPQTSGEGNHSTLNTEQVPHLKRNLPSCHNTRKLSSSSMNSPKKDRLRSVSLESYDVVNRSNGFVSNGGEGNIQHAPLNHSQSACYTHESTSPKSSRRSLYSSQASLDLAPRIDQMVESLVRTHINTPVAPLVTQGPLHLLWPQPQHIVELGSDALDGDPEEPFLPQKELHISVVQGNVSVHRILDVWDLSRTALLALGYNVKIGDIQPAAGMETESQVECTVNEDLFSHRDAYQIHISSIKVKIAAASLAGLHYALCTFTQLLRLSVAAAEQEGRKPTLPSVLIQDYPTQRHRAVLLDVSPNGRVPILDYLFHLIDVWSSLKISHLHLYTRLLPSHEWQLCYSKSEMVTIDRYCQDRFISLVPVLDVEPHVNCQHLTKMWPAFQEIIASFPNIRYVHVGPRLSSLLLARDDDSSTHRCPNDSTEAGNRSSSVSVENEDLDRSRGAESDQISLALENDNGLYGVPSFMRELWHRLDLPPNITLMLCANGLHSRFYNIPPNVVLVEYGFQADYDFVQWTQDFRSQGNMTCLCPGTASWNSLAGCPEASICNIYRAVQAAQKQGSLGVVIAHWSGSFHLTPHPFSLPGFVVGAGLAWNASTHWDYLHTSLPALLDTHVFLDSAGILGGVILELGYAETLVLRVSRGQDRNDPRDLPPQDGSALYKLLTDPDSVNLERTPVDLFARVSKHIKRCQTSLFAAKPQCRFSEMVVQELQLAADLLLTSCRIGRSLVSVGTNPNSNMGLSVINLGISNLPPTFRTDIANKLLAHIEQYKGTWLQRHLPAGLQSSLLILTSVLRRFVPDESCSSVCSDTAPFPTSGERF